MKTGIYQITNQQNKTFYIGSTARSFSTRHSEHWSKLRKNQHPNAKLQNAWNKYGEAAFTFHIVEYVDSAHVVEREQFYLDHMKPPLNIQLQAESCKGYSKSRGEKNVFATITEDVARQIYTMSKTGASNPTVAQYFNTTVAVVGKIRRGKTWKHLGFTPLPKDNKWNHIK